jgi:hypothetical protein
MLLISILSFAVSFKFIPLTQLFNYIPSHSQVISLYAISKKKQNSSDENYRLSKKIKY